MGMSPTLKGIQGEQMVKNVLLHLKQYGVRFIEDASLLSYNGNVIQIDFIVFSHSLFACIEVKNWYGKVIIPQRVNDNWQVIYDKKVVVCSSPLEQNLVHCRAAMRVSVNDAFYNNVIVLPSNPVIINKRNNTCTIPDLISILTSNKELYSDLQIESEYNALFTESESNRDKLIAREMGRVISIDLNNTNFFGDDSNG